jgi:hypothetical protein
MQTGEAFRKCRRTRNRRRDCQAFICHDPLGRCSGDYQRNRNVVVAPGTTAVRAVRHNLSDGNTLLAVTFLLSDRVMYYYSWKRPIHEGRHKTEAGTYKKHEEQNGRAVLVRLSANGKSVEDLEENSLSGTSVGVAQYEEDCDCTSTGTFPTFGCSDLDASCYTFECGGCFSLSAIEASVPGALFCSFVVCPYAYFSTSLAGCCEERGPTCYPFYST